MSYGEKLTILKSAIYDQGSAGALEELSKDAIGGQLEAQALIRQLEVDKIPINYSVEVEAANRVKTSPASELLYILAHPLLALQVLSRQLDESLAQDDINYPNPHSFSSLPLVEAMRQVAKTKELGGVPLSCWDSQTQQLFAQGQMITPNGHHPEHPNV